MNNLIGTVIQLVPYWSVEITKFCNLGNEYSMLFNVVLNNCIKIIDGQFGENVVFGMIIVALIVFVLKSGNLFGFTMGTKPTITMTAKFVNGNIVLENNFKKINKYLIEHYQIKCLKLYENKIFLIDDNQTLNFNDGLELNTHRISDPQGDKIIYKIMSYKINIQELINEVTNLQNEYVTTYEGFEHTDNQTVNYSNEMIAITHDLITNHGIKTLFYKKKTKILGKSVENNDKKETSYTPECYFNDDYEDYTENNGNDENFQPTIQSISNFKINDTLNISIERIGQRVTYILESTKNNIPEYVKKCIYNNTFNRALQTCKYHKKICYKTVNVGNGELCEYITDDSKALHYWLNKCYMVKSYQKISNSAISQAIGYGSIRSDYFQIENIENETFNGELKIKITKKTTKLGYGKQFIIFSYCIESDVIELNEFLNTCVSKYNEFLNSKSEFKLHHFVYAGFQNNSCKFKTKTLSSTHNKLNQTFDTIFNEHKEFLINDLKELKNIDYYNRTGMKRKKSYLFCGKAGTCKTNTLVAMALHDNRHIIEIPFSVLKTNEELYELMNISIIDGITLTNDNVIYAFEEIDIGLAKYDRNINNESDTIIVEKQPKNLKHEKNNTSHENIPYAQTKLSLDTILTTFDGIGNYNGKVIVATANHPEILDEAITRDLRLTKVEFKELRKIDAITIIENFFQTKLTEPEFAQIPNRRIIPSSLVALCDRFHNKPLTDFMKTDFPEFLEKKVKNN